MVDEALIEKLNAMPSIHASGLVFKPDVITIIRAHDSAKASQPAQGVDARGNEQPDEYTPKYKSDPNIGERGGYIWKNSTDAPRIGQELDKMVAVVSRAIESKMYYFHIHGESLRYRNDDAASIDQRLLKDLATAIVRELRNAG
jgi:hypothetical protein